MYKASRYIFYAALFCLGQTYTQAQPKVALVLSGGGARGLAQIGALQALGEAGIKPDYVVATSMGAIVGSLYATGYSPDSIYAITKKIDWRALFSNSARRKSLFVNQKDEPINYLFEVRFDSKFNWVYPNSISYGQTLYDNLAPLFSQAQYRSGGNFDSLPTALRIVTTDIISGKKVVFSDGNLAQCVRASCSFPLMFSPIAMDSMLLMDGGLTANIPVDVACDLKPDYIIAIDVTSDKPTRGGLDNPVNIINQIVFIGAEKQKVWERSLAECVITPDLSRYSNTDFAPFDSLVLLGYLATKPKIGDILHALDSLKVSNPEPKQSKEPPDNHMRWFAPIVWKNFPQQRIDHQDTLYHTKDSAGFLHPYFDSTLARTSETMGLPFANIRGIYRGDSVGTVVDVDPGIIKGIKITGNPEVSAKYILTAAGVHKGGTLTSEQFSEAMSSLYATGLFNNVNLSFDNGNILHIMLNEKRHWCFRTGVRFDEFHLLEGFVEPMYENLFGSGIPASFYLQYGSRREKYAAEITMNHLFSQGLATTGQIQLYISRERIVQRKEINTDSTIGEMVLNEQTLRKAGVAATIGTQLGKTAQLTGGMRIESFKVHESARDIFQDPLRSFGSGLRYFMASLIIDNLDRFPYPLAGHRDMVTVGGAADVIGGTESFTKFNASFGRYLTINKKHTLYPQLQCAWATNTLPDLERVYLGGALPEERFRSVGVYNYIPFMGLSPRAMPGDVMLLFHGMYRYNSGNRFYILSTIDWGYVWEYKSFGMASDSLRIMASEFLRRAPLGIGLSFEYETIIGPVRLAWGRLFKNNLPENWKIQSENLFYISIGHDF